MSKKCVSIVVVLLAMLCSLSLPKGIQAAEETTIVFEGNRVFITDQLRSAMSPPGEPSHATRGSNAEELQQGLQGLRAFLIAEGYVTARLGTPHRSGLPSSRRGRPPLPTWRGQIDREVTVFSETQILGAFDLKQGDTFKGDAIRVWFERLKDMYADAGYLDWRPIPRQEIKEPESASSDGTVNLTIDMDEGSRL